MADRVRKEYDSAIEKQHNLLKEYDEIIKRMLNNLSDLHKLNNEISNSELFSDKRFNGYYGNPMDEFDIFHIQDSENDVDIKLHELNYIIEEILNRFKEK